MKSYKLLDSGHRKKFKSGAVRDRPPGKGKYVWIAPRFLRRLAVIMEKGGKKYSAYNWLKGMPMSEFLDSAMRHLRQYQEGDRKEDHLGQCGFNIMALIEFEETRPDLDDISNIWKKDKIKKL